jgi:hypothetical protein
VTIVPGKGAGSKTRSSHRWLLYGVIGIEGDDLKFSFLEGMGREEPLPVALVSKQFEVQLSFVRLPAANQCRSRLTKS